MANRAARYYRIAEAELGTHSQGLHTYKRVGNRLGLAVAPSVVHTVA